MPKAVHFTLDGKTPECGRRGAHPVFAGPDDEITCYACRSRARHAAFLRLVAFGTSKPATPQTRLALKLARADCVQEEGDRWWAHPLDRARGNVANAKTSMEKALKFEQDTMRALETLAAAKEET